MIIGYRLLFLLLGLLMLMPATGRENSLFHDNNIEDLPPDEIYELANTKNKMGEHQDALLLFLRVINETRATASKDELSHIFTQDFSLHADASTHAGIIYFQRGDYPKSLEYFYGALRIYRLINDKEGEGNLLNNVGTVYFDWSEYDLALNYFHEAENIFNQNGMVDKKTILLNNIGAVYFRLGNYEQGVVFFKRSIEAAAAEKIDYLFNQLYNIGYSYLRIGDYPTAENYFIESLELAQELNNNKDISLAYAQLSKVYMEQNDFVRAEILLSKALEIANQENILEEKKLIYQALSELHERKGKLSEALDLYKKYFLINDSVFNAEKNAQIRELQILYETEKREKEIQLLNVEKQLKNHQIKSQKRWIHLLATAISIISIFLIIVYLQKRVQTRANLDLVRKNLEILENENKLIKKGSIENSSSSSDLLVQTKIPEYKNIDTYKHNGKIPETLITLNQPGIKYNSSNLSDEQKQEILQSVTKKMEKDCLYRNALFSLDQLSELIGTNRTYISQVINEQTGGSFINFINNYRIREARRMLADKNFDHLTIEAIARHVGFNSKSSFNSFFKKSTGITPSYFQKNAKITHKT